MDTRLPGISVEIRADLPGYLDDSGGRQWLDLVARQGLTQVIPPNACGQVSLLLTDDATVRELNRRYRGVDETTDVLSFSAEHGGPWAGDAAPPDAANDWPAGFPLPDGEPPPLGDIAVSVPQAIRQAEARGLPLQRELALLIVHGALHLLGHDHYAEAERDAMQRLERAALAEIFGGDGDGGAAGGVTGPGGRES